MGGAGGWGVPARVAADRAVTGAGSWAAGMGWSQDLFRALCRALSKDVKEQVGTDRFGNKYYCIPEYKNWRGHTVRERRIVEAANKREVDYEVGDIPTEWEAWIRRTRKTPPTMESPLVHSCVFFVVGPSSCGMWDAASAWFDEQCHVRAQDSNQRNTGPPAAERANLTTGPRGQPQ
ncbi:NADH dehydrogenase [ubiquinone] 1 alpha subcomplex assembly factor 2 isoform X4 [Equus asinus]|uniref:NADH dehydrogenase [ubiquinone] 1 alpha subcomplex assembly factor 2 isoform X4 n=1 Tax=Equus asinus TaxID=9793 RepID=UPI0038F7D361